MKFDYVIGNPPYQESRPDTKDVPLFHFFMDAVYDASDKVLLITPAKFLFNAGATPKAWNEKLLNDVHFKVLKYEPDSSKVFPRPIDIKGGVAIHYHDLSSDFGAIEFFAGFDELLSIRDKVHRYCGFIGLDSIVYTESAWRISDLLKEEHPEEYRKFFVDKNGKEKKNASASRFFATNVFDVLSDAIFSDVKPDDGEEYIQLYGRSNNMRVYKWINAKYVNAPDNCDYYKVFVPKSNGSGALGEVFSTPVIGEPVIGEPVIGHTQTFISIGKFDNRLDAEHLLKYVKSKFCRVMLGTLKVTQDNKKDTWRNVPLQDFTDKSDIDWTQSISDIDRQLYKKYGFSQEEIDFIEKHVKAMD